MLPSPWMYSVIAAGRQAKLMDALVVAKVAKSCQVHTMQVSSIQTGLL